MKKRPQVYSALTLFKQDIRELIQIFQNNLQNVLIIIDGHHILDSTQLEQFDPIYRATSLIAQGYYHERKWDQRIELVMHERGATLLLPCGNAVEEAEFDVNEQIKEVLSRCQSRVLQFFQGKEFILFFCLPFTFLALLQYHHVDYLLQIFFGIGSAFLLLPLAIFSFAFITRRLRMETKVFLFPGAMRTTHMHGLYETVGRWVISLILFIAFIASFLMVFHMF